jgi:hypothetical protein
MGAGQNIIRSLAGVLAVAAAALTIGLAPPASAKGVVLPRSSCTGTQIVAHACDTPPQPVPTHMLSPHGSKYRKMAIAGEQDRTNSTSDCATQSRHRS